MTNVNGEAVRDMLEERMRAGRTPLEAAGEVRFLDDVRVKQNPLSKQSRGEISQVIETWLANAMGLAPEEIGLPSAKRR